MYCFDTIIMKTSLECFQLDKLILEFTLKNKQVRIVNSEQEHVKELFLLCAKILKERPV